MMDILEKITVVLLFISGVAILLGLFILAIAFDYLKIAALIKYLGT